jgi:phage pi2 protein 07
MKFSTGKDGVIVEYDEKISILIDYETTNLMVDGRVYVDMKIDNDGFYYYKDKNNKNIYLISKIMGGDFEKYNWKFLNGNTNDYRKINLDKIAKPIKLDEQYVKTFPKNFTIIEQYAGHQSK